MGQKTHPYGFRLGYTRGWKSRWYADKHTFGSRLVEDQKIKGFIKKKLAFAGISLVEIERRPLGGDEEVEVHIHTERPGLVIGPKGRDIDALRTDVEKLTKSKLTVKIHEVQKPALDAQLVSKSIASQLEKRGSFRRVMSRAKDMTIEAGAKGIRIRVAGRLNGADIARSEVVQEGAMPLSTLLADVDYGLSEAATTYGNIGVKVWIYRGRLNMNPKVVEQEATDGADA